MSAGALAVAAALALGPCDNPFTAPRAVYGGPPPQPEVRPAGDGGAPVQRNAPEKPVK